MFSKVLRKAPDQANDIKLFPAKKLASGWLTELVNQSEA